MPINVGLRVVELGVVVKVGVAVALGVAVSVLVAVAVSVAVGVVVETGTNRLGIEHAATCRRLKVGASVAVNGCKAPLAREFGRA